MKESLSVSCPQCKKNFAYFSSTFRPFCSERCKLVDLGHWLSESYSVAGAQLRPNEIAALYDMEDESPRDHVLEDESESSQDEN